MEGMDVCESCFRYDTIRKHQDPKCKNPNHDAVDRNGPSCDSFCFPARDMKRKLSKRRSLIGGIGSGPGTRESFPTPRRRRGYSQSTPMLCYNALLVCYRRIRTHFYARQLLSLFFFILVVWIQTTLDPLHIARWIDHQLTYRIMRRHFAALRLDIQQRDGADILRQLPTTKIAKANELQTHAAFRQVLLQRAERERILRGLEMVARACEEKNQQECGRSIPRVVFLPAVGRYTYHAREYINYNVTKIFFDTTEMRTLVREVSSKLSNGDFLLRLFDSSRGQSENILIWAVCVVFVYGGIAICDMVKPKHLSDLFARIFDQGQQEVLAMGSPPSSSLQLLAAPPRHNVIHCLVQRLTLHLSVSHQFIQMLTNQKHDDLHNWIKLNLPSNHCALISRSSGSNQTKYWYKSIQQQTTPPNERDSRTSVEIKLQPRSIPNITRVPKYPLQQRLQEAWSEPGWLCNRCLNYAGMGTYEACQVVCPRWYQEIICRPREEEGVETIDLVVTVRRPVEYYQRIPRIIHQTNFEEITFDHHPQLARLQASWKNTGWEYRFYTDADARRYISEHFPGPFLDAFDSLIHGAYRADFFRYLVLLREGGVYADVDVMLESTLETFVSPDLSFFGPRDVPCEYAGEAFCIWNGLLGAEPGHPILVRAVERTVNLILRRADMYDMEQEICQRTGPTAKLWKVRAQPLLFLTGPCGLGVAFNEAFRHSPLDPVPVGWHVEDSVQHEFHRLILVGDKHDLGEFRFSDPERNFIVASTDILGSNDRSNRIRPATPSDTSTSKPTSSQHYSHSRKYMSIWGSSGVYVDDQVALMQVKLRVERP